MSRFVLGERVRIVADYSGLCPELVGTEAVIAGDYQEWETEHGPVWGWLLDNFTVAMVGEIEPLIRAKSETGLCEATA